MKLRRLNLDTSWQLQWADCNIVIDPWLTGSEVDYFPWFNEQWHTREPVQVSEIHNPDLILISQSYSDHCHEQTLKLFDTDIPIAASPLAYKRLLKSFPKERLIQLPLLAKSGYWEYNDLQIASIHPGRWLDPIYYAHVIVYQGKALFYSSHGFKFNPQQWDVLEGLDFEILLTSFSEIKLPSLLGGKVNPGIDNVNYLINKLQPKYTCNTHDEEKQHSGLVMKLAKTSYPDYDNLKLGRTQFINTQDYTILDL